MFRKYFHTPSVQGGNPGGVQPRATKWRDEMKTLKCKMLALLALLPMATGIAYADTEYGYSRMFVFGASFLDSGNNFAVTGETAHPPFDPMSLTSYGIGGHHYSNGRTWVEVMAQEMDLNKWAKPAYRDPAFGNYAYGYARARYVDYATGPSLGEQVQAWIDNGNCAGAAMNDTLFVVDSSYADFADILAGEDPELVIGGMLGSIATNIGILYGCGARNLLVANTPPLGASPGVPEPFKATATGLTWQYNLYVQGILDLYSGEPFNMNISTVDFFAFTTTVLAAPEEFGLTNVTGTCVTFGVLKDAYCKNRDEYFFWDSLHPTKKVHALIAEEALGQLPVSD
jgi:outer membrane lipase/esterase